MMKDIAQLLKEAYEVGPANDIWVNGTTEVRFDVAAGKFSKTDIWHPLFLTNDCRYAFEYSKQHAAKDFNVKRDSKDHEAVMASSKARVAFAELKHDIKLFDFTNAEDFAAIGIPAKFAKIFEHAEPYFAWNSAINVNIDSRPIEFAIAKYVLRWQNAKEAELKLATLYKGGKGRTFKDLLMQPGLVAKPISQAEYAEFYDHYAAVNWNAEKGIKMKEQPIYGKVKAHRVDAKGKNVSVAELPEPNVLAASQLSLVNIYLEFFAEFKKSCQLLGIRSLDDARLAKLDKSGKRSSGGENDEAACYVDILQLVLFMRIQSNGYDGFYCPEWIAAKSYPEIVGNSQVDAVCLFSTDKIQKSESWPCSLIMAWHDIATKVVGHDSTKSIMVYIKTMLDQGAEPQAERERILGARKKEADAKEARASKEQWLPIKPGLPNRKEAWLEQNKDKISTYEVGFSIRTSAGQRRAYNVEVSTSKNNERGARSYVEQQARKLVKDANVVFVNINSCKALSVPKLDVNVPVCQAVGLSDEDKALEKDIVFPKAAKRLS